MMGSYQLEPLIMLDRFSNDAWILYKLFQKRVARFVWLGTSKLSYSLVGDIQAVDSLAGDVRVLTAWLVKKLSTDWRVTAMLSTAACASDQV
jgi:hypothetical protein